MAALVSVDDIKVFLKNEATDDQNDTLIAACESNAEGIADNRVRGVLTGYTSTTIPADLKTAIIKISVAEFISSTNNINYVPEGSYQTDRGSKYRQEAFVIIDRYYTPKVG